jgi:hypothetical protein
LEADEVAAAELDVLGGAALFALMTSTALTGLVLLSAF